MTISRWTLPASRGPRDVLPAISTSRVRPTNFSRKPPRTAWPTGTACRSWRGCGSECTSVILGERGCSRNELPRDIGECALSQPPCPVTKHVVLCQATGLHDSLLLPTASDDELSRSTALFQQYLSHQPAHYPRLRARRRPG